MQVAAGQDDKFFSAMAAKIDKIEKDYDLIIRAPICPLLSQDGKKCGWSFTPGHPVRNPSQPSRHARCGFKDKYVICEIYKRIANHGLFHESRFVHDAWPDWREKGVIK